jgi:hypothetical protein
VSRASSFLFFVGRSRRAVWRTSRARRTLCCATLWRSFEDALATTSSRARCRCVACVAIGVAGAVCSRAPHPLVCSVSAAACGAVLHGVLGASVPRRASDAAAERRRHGQHCIRSRARGVDVGAVGGGDERACGHV